MSLKTKPALVFVFLVVVFSATAQMQTKTRPIPYTVIEQKESTISDDGKAVVEPYNGTFRFIFTKGVKQIFADEIFKTIELNRKEEEEVTLILSSYCKVQILSKKQIRAVGFIPFSKSYVFEN